MRLQQRAADLKSRTSSIMMNSRMSKMHRGLFLGAPHFISLRFEVHSSHVSDSCANVPVERIIGPENETEQSHFR